MVASFIHLRRACSYYLSDPMAVSVCLEMELMGWKGTLTWLAVPVSFYRGLILAQRRFVRL